MDEASLRSFKQVRFTRVLLTLWLTYCCYTMVRRPFSVARAEIEKELDISAARLSWVDTAFVVAYSISQLFYSALKKRLGYTRILLLGFAASIASCVVLTCSSSVIAFTLAWAVNGLAQGTGWASCMELLSTWVFPAERGRVMGVWSTSMAAGGVLGNVVPAFLMGRQFSWKAATLTEVVCGPCAVLAVTAIVLKSNPNQVGFPSVQQVECGVTVAQLRETPKMGSTIDGEYIFVSPLQPVALGRRAKEGTGAEEGCATAGAAEPLSTAGGSTSALTILRLPGVLGYSLAYFVHKLVRYAFMLWLPYFLSKEGKTTAEDAGYIASAFDAGGVVGIVMSGYASDYFFRGRRRILVLQLFTLGMAVSTFCFGAFIAAFARSPSLSAALVFLVGLFSFAIDALQTGSALLGLCDRVGCSVGPVSGVVGCIGSLGSALQGVFAILFTNSGGTLFFFFSALTVVAMLLMARPLAMESSGLRSAK